MRPAALALALIIPILPTTAHAGAVIGKEQKDFLGRDISICFVGDAVTKRASRVEQILADLKAFEYAANIKFNALGACPPPGKLPNGNDDFGGDVRIVIPNVSIDGSKPIPGKGCPNPDNSGWGSWGRFPYSRQANRSCMFNVKLGDDPWRGRPYLNHTLHEVGHALGFLHEHSRVDTDLTGCDTPGYGGSIKDGLITTYDPASVMHYSGKPDCKIIGNYAFTGLSDKDKLAFHIVYPEDTKVAEFIGSTVAIENQNINLRFAWHLRGAIVDTVASNFQWKVDGQLVPKGQKAPDSRPDLNRAFPVGMHPFEYGYTDFLGRRYTYSGVLRVLSNDAYTTTIVAPVAAALAIR